MRPHCVGGTQEGSGMRSGYAEVRCGHPRLDVSFCMTPDPPPIPPEKPLASDCCEGGCDRCVFDLYAEAAEQYEVALAAWRERHPGAGDPPS
jgi:oxidoreductase family protein